MKHRVCVVAVVATLMLSAVACAAKPIVPSDAAKGNLAALMNALDGGADAHATDRDGATALHYAVAGNQILVVKLLISRKANVNARKNDGVTPLHVAAALGRTEIAKLLLTSGADPRIADKKGRLPSSLWKPGIPAPVGMVGEKLTSGESDPRMLVDGNLEPDFVVPSGNAGPALCMYTTSSPPDAWTKTDFDDSSWLHGGMPFGSGFGPSERSVTSWDSSDLWVRRIAELPNVDCHNLELYGRHDDSIEIYINGDLAHKNDVWKGSSDFIRLPDTAQGLLHPGKIVVAIHVKNTGGPGYLDIGIAKNPMQGLPTSGWEAHPKLAAFGEAVRRVMIANNIPAGTIAIMKGDRIVVLRAFGWADKRKTHVLEPNAIMRLASNDKVVTSIALRELIDRHTIIGKTGKQLSYDSRLLDILEAYGIKAPTSMDLRWKDITIQSLCAHTSGCPDVCALTDMRKVLNYSGAWTSTWNVRYLLTQPLRYSPGEKSVYNSTGYFLLRYVIHIVSGDIYRFLKDDLFTSCGTTDVRIASDILAGRDPREPFYVTLDPPLDWSPGLEHYYALSASAEAMVRLYRHYHLGGLGRLTNPVTGQWAARPDNGTGVFFGGMTGTATVTVQRRYDELSYAVLFNKCISMDALFAELQAIADKMPADAWNPTGQH